MFLGITTVGFLGHLTVSGGYNLITINELSLMNKFIGNLKEVDITKEALSTKEKFLELFSKEDQLCAKLVYESFDEHEIDKLFRVDIALVELTLTVTVQWEDGREEVTQFTITEEEIAFNSIHIEILKSVKEIGYYDWKKLEEMHKFNPVAVSRLAKFFPKEQGYKVLAINGKGTGHPLNSYNSLT